MKRFMLLAMILLIVAIIGVPTTASGDRYAYVTAARDSAGNQNAGFTMSGLSVSGSRFSGPVSGWASSGAGPYYGPGLNADGTTYTYTGNYCYYSSDATPQKWGQWTFNVPDEADKSGYYDVYFGIRFGMTTAQDMPPIWTMTNASGTDFINSTQTTVDSVASNKWVKIATQLQFNRGQSYTARCATLGIGTAGKRMNYDMVAWVFVKTNSATGLTATVNLDATAIDLAWTAPDPAPATYTIQRKAGVGGTYEDLATGVTTTSYSDTTALCGFTYYYRVICIDGNGVASGASAEAYAQRCALGPPGKATNPNYAMDTTGCHTDLSDAVVPGSLSWLGDGAATSHDVYFGTVSGALEFKGNQVGGTYAPGALLANTDYYWRIDEKNDAGTTTGDEWHFKTGMSLTIKAIRPAKHGNGEIDHYFTDFTSDAPRAWDITTWHNAGDNIYMSVTCNTPYTWVGWSVNADGSSPFDGNGTDPIIWSQQWMPYVMPNQTSNLTLYAVYTTDHYALTTVCDPVAGGTITATNLDWPAAALTEFEEGERAHLVATPAAGYVFAGWESDQTGTFVDRFAATTNYTMTAANTQIKAYFAKAAANIASTGTRCISADSADGTGITDWWTTQTNIGAYSPTNNQVFARILCQYPKTIPAVALRHGLCRLAAGHSFSSNYSSSTTLTVHAYPVLAPWVYSTTEVGAWWNTTDGTIPWTTPGGDMDTANELGTAQTFVGNPSVDVTKTYMLDKSVDYGSMLVNGIEFKGDEEGDITFRKGFTKTSALNFFYNPPTGANSGVITNWAFLGAYAQGVDGDHQPRIDTDQVAGTYNGVDVTEMYLAPKIGATYNGKTWKAASSATDIIDLLDPAWAGAGSINCASYAAVYVKNPGESLQYYIGLGSDDFSKTWLDTSTRAYKSVASGVAVDQVFQGPFTMGTGWHRLMAKIENGAVAYGFYLRLANADRTALTGVDTFTFATSDDTAPTNPTASEAGGAQDGVAQSAVTSPVFTFAGAADPEVAGEGVSGVKGFRVYFGTDENGVPETFQTSWTVTPAGPLAEGTYYLRVSTVDMALNESAPATVFTFILGAAGPDPAPENTPLTKITDLWPLVNDGTTVYGFADANGKTVTAVWDNGFWVEETSRNAGIKVELASGAYTYFDTAGKSAFAAGDVVDIYGTLVATAGSDRVFLASYVRERGSVTPIAPLAVTQKYIVGKQASANTPGLPTGKGIYSAGLFVKLAGAVLTPGADYFFLDDKTYAAGTGIKVLCGSLPVPAGPNVVVTGAVGMVGNNPVIYATSIQ